MITNELINIIEKLQNIMEKDESIYLTEKTFNIRSKYKNQIITLTNVKEN